MLHDSRPRPGAPSGFTIVELLIAATISLILTYAVIQMFDYVASEARYGRASIELAGQLRSASRRISRASPRRSPARCGRRPSRR